MKPLLKREVNNEAFFTSLKPCYQIHYIACYTQYIYSVVGLGLGGTEARLKREPSDDVIILSQP